MVMQLAQRSEEPAVRSAAVVLVVEAEEVSAALAVVRSGSC